MYQLMALIATVHAVTMALHRHSLVLVATLTLVASLTILLSS